MDWAWGEKIEEYEGAYQRLAPYIVTCHLHDNYGEHDDHNPPGEGNIDWQELDALLDTLPRLYHAETESGIWDKKSWQAFCSVLGKHSAD